MSDALSQFLHTTLSANEAAVFLLRPDQRSRLESMLPAFPPAEAEIRRAERIRDLRQRELHLTGQFCARGLIAETLRISGGAIPAEIPWVPDADGRPHCPLPDAPDINLSHTRDWLAVAVLRAGRVGVDLECTRRRVPGPKVAERFFHPAERQTLQADDPRTFFRIWTRKEAWTKAIGLGLARGRVAETDTFALAQTGKWVFSEWQTADDLQLCAAAPVPARLFLLQDP